MAKYQITYTCGHAGEIQIYGKQNGRQGEADRQASRLCPECWAAKLSADRAEAAAKASEEAKTAGFATLTGSAKQVSWAETIRANLMAEVQKLASDHEQAKAIIAALNSETSASWWIDNRNNDGRDLMISVAKRIF